MWQNSMNQKDKNIEVSQASQSQRSCRTGRETKHKGRMNKEIRKGKGLGKIIFYREDEGHLYIHTLSELPSDIPDWG